MESNSAIWAWLENNDPARANDIYELLEEWRTTAWRESWDQTLLNWIRVLYQYGDRIDPTQRSLVEGQFDEFIRSRWGFHNGTLNNRMYDFVVRYLWSQNQPDVTVQYGAVPFDPSINLRSQLDQFTYEGREYILTYVYNSLQLSRDWLYWMFEILTTAGDGNEELDSQYTRTFIESLYTLYDFAYDPEMKRKAKIMLDFILLDSILDVSANLHGGHIGRFYGYMFLVGHPQIYHWIYWGIGPDPQGRRDGQFYNAYVSTYRVPELIEDLGILDDEPDNYWHLHKENNRAGFLPGEYGKWTYVTKYYNLGGSTRHWTLNIKSSTSDFGIRFWINNIPRIYNDEGQIIETLNDYFGVMTLGMNGFQYQNVIFIKLNDPCLHISDTGMYFAVYEDGDDTGNLFDIDETIEGRRFFREGNVAVCVYMETAVSAIEVAIIGVDYPTYGAFRDACLYNAGFINNYTAYQTSKGDVIAAWWDNELQVEQTFVNYQPLWQFPFNRMETEAYNGQMIVEWNREREFTVKWHGQRLFYDLYNWTYTSEVNVDTESPSPPQGVTVAPTESN
ncbi:hypothetical protein JW824_10665 [bacterium]|nr:hypothetical protein [bacterium]